MDFSAWVISKGLGPTPVKLGYSSFSTRLQIKQSCLAKQNPLQSYFPPSVWPGKIQRNHSNPEAIPHWETLDQSDWRKGPINTLSRPFLKLSTSSVGVRESLTQPCVSPSRGATSQAPHAPPCLRNPPELKTFAFQPVSFISSHHLSQTHFTRIDDILTSHIGSRPSKSLARYCPSHWSCVHLLPESSSCSLQACCLFRCLQKGRLSSVCLQW